MRGKWTKIAGDDSGIDLTKSGDSVSYAACGTSKKTHEHSSPLVFRVLAPAPAPMASPHKQRHQTVGFSAKSDKSGPRSV